MAETVPTRRRALREASEGEGDSLGLRWRKTRALLASGAVLGVGSTATLASWSASQHATAELVASEFDVGFSDETQALTFNPVFDELLEPGSSSYAALTVFSTENSIDGSVELTVPEDADNGSGLGQYVHYRVAAVSGGLDQEECTGEVFTSEDTVVDGPLTSPAAPDATAQSLAGGEVITYCFEFSLPEDTPIEAQNMSVTAEWEFIATSE